MRKCLKYNVEKRKTIYKILYVYIMYMLQNNIVDISMFTENKYGEREWMNI